MRILLQGAELVCVPTAWLSGFDQLKWDDRGLAHKATGAIVQANLAQVFIACASQGDSDAPEFLGSSIVAGPTGDLLAVRCRAPTSGSPWSTWTSTPRRWPRSSVS